MEQESTAPIFDWSNFNELASYLFGQSSEPDHLEVSPRGHLAKFILPDHIGEGRMEFLTLSSGLRILVFDCCWKQETSCRIMDGDWIRFNFSLSANMTMQPMDSGQVFSVFPSWRIVNTLEAVETVETLFADQKLVWVTICCKPEYLSEICGIAIEDMPVVLQSILTLSGSHSVHDLFDFTVRLNAIATDIIRCDLPDGLRIAYIEARAIELLCYGLDYVMNPRDNLPHLSLSNSDKRALNDVHLRLESQFANPPSVAQLAKDAGINRNKLFYGFKTMFGSTVSEFVRGRRLEEGHRLLLDTNASIIEIAEQVGFQHQCNFSTAIKKQFGKSPSQLRGTGA